MLDVENLKNGICIKNKTETFIRDLTEKEGVIVDILKKNNKLLCNIIWFYIEHLNPFHTYSYSFEETCYLADLNTLDYSHNCHFCRIKNLYSVMLRYLYKRKKLFFLGVCTTILKKNNNVTEFIYFKTENNTFLEIILCYPNINNFFGETMVWINESDSIYNLHLNNSKNSLYFFDRIKEVNLKDLSINNSDICGVDFYDDSEILLSICTSVNKSFRNYFINGLDTMYNDVVYSPHNYDEFVSFVSKV